MKTLISNIVISLQNSKLLVCLFGRQVRYSIFISIFFILHSSFFILHSKAQCPYDNFLWTDLTPPACPGSNSTSCMWGGDYVTVDVVFGNIYTFTTCGNFSFDTQITLYTVGGGTLLSYNDDDCGLQSTITWTATFTGTVHVLVDAYDCVDQSACMTLEVSCTGGGGGPVVASDCADAVDVCTNLDFTIDPNGYGSIDEIPSLGSLGNPDNNNPGGSGNWGCLRAGELNSTWMIINISGSGILEFNFGGASQSGFYDWIMYPWSPTSCTDIPNNTVAPVRCNWNACSGGGTGLRNVPPPPPGGCNGNFEPPLSVTCGEKFIIVFSNWSSVTTNVPLDFSGTATVDCNPLILTVSASPPNPTICLGGSVTLSATGATTYTWSPATGLSCTTCANSVASPTVTTTYTVIGQTGCNTGDTTITVTVTPGITLTTSKTDIACNGVCTGEATVFPSGGTTPYTYSWSPSGETGAIASNLCAGEHIVTVSDNSGCVAIDTVTINEPPPLTVTASGTNITCNGFCNGIATSSPSGGNPPYTYAWSSGGGNLQNAINLCPDTYIITVTDANGCTANDSIVITEPPILTVTASSTDESCEDACDGTVSASATGGVGGYVYSWNGGLGTGANQINVCEDSYTVTVTDANGCTANATTTVNPGSEVEAGFIYNGNQCLTGNSFNFTNTGTEGATYSWIFPSGTLATSVSENPTGITWSAPGTYTVTQTVDIGGCITTSSLTITVYGEPTASIVGTDVTCNGFCNGAANLTVGGSGTAPYSYLWSNGSTTKDLTALCPGIYSVTVTDINGCTATDSITITEPDTLVLTPSSVDATCGNSDGQASVSVAGGMPSYTYSWNSIPPQTTPIATALPAGSYTVTVTDANGCTVNTTIAVNDAGSPTAAITASTDPSCTVCDGDATVTVTGGITPYTYLWDDPGSQINPTATGLCAGTFTVTVTDSANCVTTVSVTLNTTGVGTVSITLDNNVSCDSACDGQATAVMSGGTSPFTYQWDDLGSQTTAIATGLCPGIYTVTVTDSGGCITADMVTITEPSPLTSTINGTDASCNGVCDGSADLIVSGGVAPYAYSWSNGSNLEDLTNLCIGIYDVTITDVNGCIVVDSVIINEPAAISLTTNVSDANCGQSDGSAMVVAAGGTGSYTYLWDDPGLQTTATATGLSGGCYNVIVTDSAGCNATAPACVNNLGGGTASVVLDNDASCKGLCDGQATASIAGGTPPYAYLWDDPSAQTTLIATGLCSGAYSITITDDANCVTSASITVSEPDSLITVITDSNDLLCNGVCLGNATVVVSGGTGSYTYSWNTIPVQTTAMATGLCAVSYNMIVMDANGCSATVNVTINEPLPINVTITKTDARCNASCDGDASAALTGGTGPYTYSWNTIPVQTTANATALCAGTYDVTIIDANGCTGTNSITINEPAAITVSVSTVDATCGQVNGSATANPSGGTSPYTYLWVNSGNTNAIDTGLSAAGSPYEVVVSDANGCSVSGFANISDVGGPTAFMSDSTDVTCPGGFDGQAVVTVTDGVPPYAFSWDDPFAQTNSGVIIDTAFGLPAGTYIVEVRDAFNCVTTVSVTITEPSLLIAAIIAGTDANCNSICNGNATATAVGGTPPYTWLWDDPANQTTDIAVNLCAGNYTVTVTDANGCTASSPPFTINEPPPLTLTITETDATCIGVCDGSVAVSVIGGTLPYAYQWNDPDSQNTATATGLCLGTYIITVTDNNGCGVSSTVIISAPVAVDASIFNFGNIDCNGNCNGYAQSQVIGGTSPYTYSWSNGQTTDIATNLCAGTSYLSITDNNGCIDTTSVIITEPSPLTIVMTFNNMSCYNTCDGDATASVSGGVPPYTYLWDDPDFQNSPTAANLCNGTFNVNVTDANNCTVSGAVTIAQPQLLILIETDNVSSTCGDPNGSVCVAVVGGVFPFNIQWNDPNLTVGTCIDSVFAGVYNPVVTDVNGCTYTIPVAINDIIGPDIDTVITTEILCNGGTSMATVTLVPLIGTPPFVYLWKEGGDTIGLDSNDVILGLSGGTYTITVIDANGCVESKSFTIIEPTPMASAIITSNDVSCFGACDGDATVAVGGGTLPYNYLWSPSGQTTPIATGLCADMHYITITDVNGCTTISSDSINEPDLLEITPAVTDVSCFGGSDGQITLLPTPVGGTPPYIYSWFPNVGSFATVTNLIMGVYTVTVTDIRGCTAVQNVTVNEPPQLTASGTSSPSTCGNANGMATVNLLGGTPSYTYLWDDQNNQTNDTAFGLNAGSYNVTVTDANGCILMFPLTVTDVAGPVIDSISITDVTCVGNSNGTATVSISGGTFPFTYLWDDSLAQTTPTAISLAADSVSVTVTDLNSCTATASITVGEPVSLTLAIIRDTTICNGDSAKIYASVAGGTAPYSYDWSDNLSDSTTHFVNPSITTTYSLTVFDANTCAFFQTVTVTVTPLLSVTAAPDTICDGDNAIVSANASGGDGSYTYLWDDSLVQTTSSIIVSPDTTTLYTVIVSDGCSIATATATVLVNPLPVVTFNWACDPDPFITQFNSTINGGTPPYVYNWDFDYDGIAFDMDATGDTVPHSYNVSGNYNVRLIVSDNLGCSNDTTVAVQSPPTAQFDLVPINGETSILNPVIGFRDASYYNIVSWEWDFDDGITAGPGSNTIIGVENTSGTFEILSHTYGDTGTYYVLLTVENANGCVDTVGHFVEITSEYIMFAPSAFSPNKDGDNDYFFPKGIGINKEEFEISIYDRWGNLIYEYAGRYDQWLGWDGRANGGKDIAQQDVYVWLIRVKDLEDEDHEHIGHVTLLR